MIKLLQGDCVEVLKELEDNSVDSIVTDPPYGLSKKPDIEEVLRHWLNGDDYIHKGNGFMGKTWDSFVPGPAVWRECMRVLKPGGHLVAFFGSRTYDMGTIAVRMAGFEIRDQIMWVYGCYSEDTECFTQNGWKNYKDIEVGKDQILQWDSGADQFSWYTPTEVLVYNAPEKMVRISNRHTDQLLTENHTVHLKYKKNSRNIYSSYTIMDAKDIKKCWHKVFPIASYLQEGRKVNEAYLIGWWFTDAWLHGDGKACMFSQSKKTTLDKLRKALVEADCSFSEYTKTPKKETHAVEHTFYVTGNLANYLIDNYANREITWDILEWDFASRFLLLEGLLDGDGTRNITQYSETFWSKNEKRLDIVSALCTTLGIRNHIDYKKGCVYLNRKTNTTELQNKHTVETVNYKEGKVWCLRTETGAFLVRRNGRPFISGNSGFPKSQNISKAIDKKFGAEREIVGQKVRGDVEKAKSVGNTYASADANKNNKAIFGYGIENITVPATDEAKQWDGFGTALKPAHEPIVLARKPLSEKTIVDNVLKWGTGALNIDGCRVGYSSDYDKKHQEDIQKGQLNATNGKFFGGKGQSISSENLSGRFPANMIHDGSEEVVEMFPQSKGMSGGGVRKQKSEVMPSIQVKGESDNKHLCRNDSGSAARFFYSAKCSKKDRNEGLPEGTEKNQYRLRDGVSQEIIDRIKYEISSK